MAGGGGDLEKGCPLMQGGLGAELCKVKGHGGIGEGEGGSHDEG